MYAKHLLSIRRLFGLISLELYAPLVVLIDHLQEFLFASGRTLYVSWYPLEYLLGLLKQILLAYARLAQ